MIKLPPEIRDLTTKSVEEARKAFEAFTDAARKASAQAEDAAAKVQSSAKDVSAKALDFTEAHVKAAFEHAQKLVDAQTPQEFLAHQAEYVKSQLAALEKQAKELGAAITKKGPPDKT
ncbi:MAG: phasin family protein [Methylocapsa sp.]|nr:phasin family protein [Methylocapsa sp.]